MAAYCDPDLFSVYYDYGMADKAVYFLKKGLSAPGGYILFVGKRGSSFKWLISGKKLKEKKKDY